MPHRHLPYSGLAKLALRMRNAFVTNYYGALNFSCYNGDSAPGGELPGLLLVKRTHGSYMDLAAGGHRGAGHGECPAPLSCPVGSYLPDTLRVKATHDQEHKTMGFRLPGGLRVR